MRLKIASSHSRVHLQSGAPPANQFICTDMSPESSVRSYTDVLARLCLLEASQINCYAFWRVKTIILGARLRAFRQAKNFTKCEVKKQTGLVLCDIPPLEQYHTL